MSKTAMIRTRTDAHLKEQVEQIFDRFGLNATTRKAMKDAEAGRTIKGFKNTDDLFHSLNS